MGRELPSPSLFKEEAQQLQKGEKLGWKTLFLPQFNTYGKPMLMGIRGDAPGPMGCALVNETSPSQIGCCLGMAHHYHAPGARIRVHPHVGDSLLPQAGPWNDPTMEPPSRGAQRASWVNWAAQVKH